VGSVLGVDGWRGGWIGARVEPGVDRVEWMLLPGGAAVLGVEAAVTAIDIPMGLQESGSRSCDIVARMTLYGAGSTVFPAPVRPVLHCRSHREALEMLRGRGGMLISAQAFGLVKKIKDIDDVLMPAMQDRVIEVHPELSFRRLAGVPRMPRKKTAAGVGARLEALRRWLPSIDRDLTRVPEPIPIDDALDALACAWTAQQMQAGRFERLGDGERDIRGLLMQIIDPRPEPA
jgi:predicted RNase H-like nuclease